MVGREITQMFPKQAAPIGEVALSVRNLGLEGRFRDISFDLRKGEILGLAGLVGSGRSNVAETLFGVTPATRRYNLTFSVSARNVLNHVNLASPIGNLSSPLFGQSNALMGPPFSSGAANRRIDLQVLFSF